MKTPPPTTRAEVCAIKIPLGAKAILCWLLDQAPRKIERAEIAEALGSKEAHVEIELVRMQRRAPVLLDRWGPDGEPLPGRTAFIPASSPLRAAWIDQIPPWERNPHPGSVPATDPRAPKPKKKAAANG